MASDDIHVHTLLATLRHDGVFGCFDLAALSAATAKTSVYLILYGTFSYGIS